MNHSSREERNVSIAVIAMIAALGLLGLVAITIVAIPLHQQAEAAPGCEKGLPRSAPAFNSSQGRCFHP